jgi:hypothetical protein
MKWAALLAALTSLCAACGSSQGETRAAAQAPARARPTFVARVDNAWFPLPRGMVWIYRGLKDGERSRDVVRVGRITRVIDGVRCVSVSDRLYERGRLAERTTDWYAQDATGTVWYFGEDTAELDRAGHVRSTEGTWRSGVDGAHAGVFMPATPHVGQSFRQEYLKGRAEDHFQVISVTGRRLVTKEWTPLEPGVVDHKVYVRDIGLVTEETVRGGNERAELTAVRRR